MERFLKNSSIWLVGSAMLLSCGSKEAAEQKPVAPTKVSVRPIALEDKAERLRYSGSIDAENTVQIGFAVPGTVSSVHVGEGQHVAAGQLLSTVDPVEYDNALMIADASLEQAEDMYTRLEGLYKKGSLPAKDYVDIKSKVAQARASRNLALKRVKDSKLYAPVSGVISSKNVEKGATVAPGIPAFTIINLSKVYARITVPESEIGKIRKGQTAQVSVPTLGSQVAGKIAIINPIADAVAKTYTVKIQLPNPDGKLLPGMITDAEIGTGQSNAAITIPATAVVRDANDITYVFVATNTNRAVKRRITASGLRGTDIVVSEGLQQGDKVVVSGQTKLKDGATITL
nr:efflux RND transporter periplasmic adaptor subunit [uncultured Dyadobacter sp.]